MLRVICILCLAAGACVSQVKAQTKAPPTDPIASVSASELRRTGLAFARRGDLLRAQQYLSAAHLKGYEETVVVPELVKVCIAASRLRAALEYGESYLQDHPDDAGMSYVIGTIHLALGNLGEASLRLQGALRPAEVMIDAAFSLALIASRRGQLELADEHLRRYLAHKPSGRYALRARAMLSTQESAK